MSEPHLVTIPLSREEARELHLEALTNDVVKNPIERALAALDLGAPRLGAGVWRLLSVTSCPQCGASAPEGRPDLGPWVVRARSIVCDGGHELGVREMLELFCDDDEKLDATLDKIQAGKPSIKRVYFFEMRLNKPQEGEPARWRRSVGLDPIATLRYLGPDGDSVVRAVCVDAIDVPTAEAAARRKDAELPWREPLPLDFKGELTRTGWHGAELSRPERELERRRPLAG